jgi:ribonuclease-3
MSEEKKLEAIYQWVKKQRVDFRNKPLLIQALTHRSYLHEKGDFSQANESLEFVGDSVLSLSVTHYIYNRLGQVDVGDLAKLRARLISAPVLAEVARRIGLKDLILLGRNEEENQGREKDSILADSLEAFIGALFLDRGLEEADRWIRKVFGHRIEQEIKGPTLVDYKTAFQEKMAREGASEIVYRVTRAIGPDHDKTFYVQLQVDSQVWGEGSGKSKKEAEQIAAREALRKVADITSENKSIP